jgi:periplasmic protein TonB
MTIDHLLDPERLVVPPDMLPRAELQAAERRPGRIEWTAFLLAAIVHAVLILWPLLDLFGSATLAPEPIPIQIVLAPPPAPPAPPQPPPKPQLHERQSGADTETTAPPSATDTAPPVAPPAPPPPAPERPTPTPVPAARPESSPSSPAAAAEPRREAPRPAAKARQEAQIPRAPQPPKPELRDRAVGEEEHTGDPYLNHLWALIERNRSPTTPIGPAGLHLEGTSVFEILVDRGGNVEALRLIQSSGAPQLDQEAQAMINKAQPFPPLPPDYPKQIVVKITLHLFPE